MSGPGSVPVAPQVRKRWLNLRIATPRLELRPVETRDAAEIFAWFNDWEVVKHLTGPPWPYTAADADAFTRMCAEARAEGREFIFSMVADGAVVGTIGWRNWLPNKIQDAPGPNIGYSLARAHWGKGFMSEAVTSLVARIFEATGEPAIYSGAFAANMASRRVLAKAGFEEVGEGTLAMLPDKVQMPHVNMALTRASWGRRR